MAASWRLLDTGVSGAARNMALEQVLLDSRINGDAPDTLHFLEFSPCVLLGYHQAADEEVDADYCRSQGIEINRRISGGGCIYMDEGTLGWEIVAKKDTPGIPGNLEAMYEKLCGGLIRALSAFAVSAAYRPLNDIEVAGRKISGTGGTGIGDSLIFHGTVLVDHHPEIMEKALRIPDKRLAAGQAPRGEGRVVSMRELLGCAPEMAEVKERICWAFAEMLDIKWEAGGLTGSEEEGLRRELPRFASEEWIYRR